jgi:hypothetical protein
MSSTNVVDEAVDSKPNELTSFLRDFVCTTFLPRMEQHFRDRADAIFQSSDMWLSLISADEQTQLHASVPVLASSAHTLLLCEHVGQLMQVRARVCTHSHIV